MRLYAKDLKKLVKLTSSSVEWGGTLKKEGAYLKVNELIKGSEYGIDLKSKNNDILFHTHSETMIKENCGNDYPSAADIDMIIRDKIKYNIALHVLVTPTKVFYIESKRTVPLSMNKLNRLDNSICNKKLSLRTYIDSLKKDKIMITYYNNGDS